LNRPHTCVSEVIASHGEPPWTERLIETDQVTADLICRAPGDSSRRHYHPGHDEFWVVMGGEQVWEIEGQEPIHAKTGDILRALKGKAHIIRTVGDGPALRLAINDRQGRTEAVVD